MSTPTLLQPSTMEQAMFAPGVIQGNYRLEGVIAETARSEVYRGAHMITGQLVAVKFAKGYEEGGPNPIAHEASIFKSVQRKTGELGLGGLVPFNGSDIYGLHGNLPHIATELQKNGTYRDVLGKEDEQAYTSPQSIVFQEMKEELEELIEAHNEEDVEVDLLIPVKEAAHSRGISDELAKTQEMPAVETVVEAVVEAAEQVRGLDPNGITAQVVALQVVEEAASIERVVSANSNVSEEVKPVPTRQEIIERLHMLGGVAAGYHTLHSAGYVHRDGRPENYLIDSTGGGLLLGDLSAAVKDGYHVDRRDASSGNYVVPEEMNAAGDGVRYTSASDMHMFSSVILESVTGLRPYPASSQEEVVNPRHHEPRGLDRLSSAPIEREIKRMILRGMSTQTHDRPTALQFAAALGRY